MWLLDTNVISEVQQKLPNRRVLSWLDAQNEEEFFLSAVTFAELHRGVCKLPASNRRKELRTWIETHLRERFSGRVLPIDEAVAEAWGELMASTEAIGQRIPALDGFIAATAQVYQLKIVTRNTADFRHAGVLTFNPWTDSG